MSKATTTVRNVLLLLLIGQQSVSARLLAKLDYSLAAETHTEQGRDNEIVSTLDLSLSENLKLAQSRLQYNFQTSAILDHANSRDNLLLTGFLLAEQNLFTPSLTWDLGITARQSLNTAGGDNDEFDAQTLTTITTGPALRLTQGIRGSIEVEAKKRIAIYQDSPLDSDSNLFSAAYLYPFNPSLKLITKIEYESTDYKEDSNKNQDNDISRFSVGLQRQTDAVSYLFKAGIDQVNSESTDSQTLASLEATIDYQLNSASRLTFQFIKSAETDTNFNNDVVDDEDTILVAGLIESEKIQGSFDYRAALYQFNILGYLDNIENISDDVTTAETQTGLILNYGRKLTQIMDLETYAKFRNNDLKQQETQDFDLTLVYKHSRKLVSRISIRRENDSVSGVDSNDSILLYKMTVNLY